MKTLFLPALIMTLAFSPAARASGPPNETLGALLDATVSPSAVFDGSRFAAPSVAAPAAGSRHLSPSSANETAADQAPAPKTIDVAPTSAHGISDGRVGLYSEDDFVLGTGRCESCRGPREGKWYFLDEVIATPKTGAPALVWIGSHELIEGATLTKDGTTVRLKDGSELPFALTPKIASNTSYYDASSVSFFSGRTLRIRGEYALVNGVRTLVARTIWPEDYRIDAEKIAAASAATSDDIDKLVAADGGGAKGPFSAKLLWERSGESRDWDGMAVMGFMLNGGQGDDDETLGGHFSFFTGVYPAGGGMADWMFDNFYDMDQVSEKAIVASMVPLDKYMADLNSGQSWYRPTDMLVLVLKDQRAPLALQEKFKDQYAKYYAHEIKYDSVHKTCAALIVDPLKEEGWNLPADGPAPEYIAAAAAKAVVYATKNPAAGQKIYESLREEPTRLFPRASFDSAGGDLLSMAGAGAPEAAPRKLSPLESEIKEDLLAILYVRLPQLPSSRPFGSEAAGGVMDYMLRVPLDHSKWKTHPTPARPFPPQ
ncbi:MAG: hypothetical protein ACHQ2Z_06005 [Elusimicrobiota bacterium]